MRRSTTSPCAISWPKGMLTAKSLFPKEFSRYEFDEVNYIRSTMRELRKRQAMGVDVSAEIEDAMRYCSKSIRHWLTNSETSAAGMMESHLAARIRSTVGDLAAVHCGAASTAYRACAKVGTRSRCGQIRRASWKDLRVY